MREVEGSLTAEDGLELRWTGWLPEKKARAVVMLFHGFGEHIGRYGNVAGKLVQARFAVYGCDLRGHGRSGGNRGYVDSFCQYIRDGHRFREQVVAAGDKLPLFILGHSMGSIIAMNYAAEHGDFSGLVLSGTGAESPLNNPAQLYLARLMAKLAPGAGIKFPLAADFISRDPSVVEAYKADPLVHNRVSFRLAVEMSQWLQRAVAALPEIKLPTLVQCGSADQSFAGQRELFQRLGSKDKEFHLYPGLRHEVYNELDPDREAALEHLETWLTKHL